jgi:hypothetical protein
VAKRGLIDPLQQNVITAVTGAGAATVEVPAGAFLDISTVTVSATISTATLSGSFTLTCRGITLGVTPGNALQKDITLTIPYRDEDITGMNESRLAIAYYDDIAARWVDIRSSVDPGENRVTCRTSYANKRFIILELPSLVTDLKNVRVYPNPYKPGSGTDFDNTSLGEGIVFSNLTQSFKLKIFTVAGDLVFSKEDLSDAYGSYLWDTKNEQGVNVASGVYIYLIENALDSSQSAKGKFSILR